MNEKHRRDEGNGFPLWLNSIVVLGLLGLLSWNVIVVGPEGYPTSGIIGTLLGGYLALDRNLKRRNGDNREPSPDRGTPDDDQ